MSNETLTTRATQTADQRTPVSPGRLLREYDFALPLFLAVAALVANLVFEKGGFGLTDQLANVAPLAIAAIASAPSIIGGGLDLSISPLIFFVNAAYVVWLAPHGVGGAAAIPLMLVLGAAIGAITGSLILLLRVDAIVVTLAMYFALQGLDLVVAPNPVNAGTGWMGNLAGSVGPIPGALFTILVPLALWWALRFTPFRSYLYATGSNAETAYSSGVNVAVTRLLSYALGGLFAGIGAIALTALVQSSTATSATEYTLPAVAAVVLGGVSLAGGRGRLFGVVLGACVIYLVQNVLSVLHINQSWLQVVYGAVLIFAVVVVGMSSGRRETGGRTFPARRRPRLRAADSDGLAGVDFFRPAQESTAPPQRHRMPWQLAAAAQKRFPVVQLLVVVLVFFYGDATLQGFGSWDTIKVILLTAALVGLASVGQTLLILIGGFDLSVSGFIVAGALTTTVFVGQYHMSFIEALAIAIVGSGLLGAFAGQVCHRFRINPLIVTLAMGSIAVGIVEVQAATLAGVPPQWLQTLAEPATNTFGVGIPPLVVIWVVVALLLGIFLHRTVAGRHMMATGANPRAADYALISTRRIWTFGFAFSAIISALVGVVIAGYAGGVQTDMGDPYLFMSVVAVLVGGTIFGGPGDYTRTLIGALLLSLLTIVLVGHGADQAAEYIVYGAVILIAVAAYARRGRLGAQL